VIYRIRQLANLFNCVLTCIDQKSVVKHCQCKVISMVRYQQNSDFSVLCSTQYFLSFTFKHKHQNS